MDKMEGKPECFFRALICLSYHQKYFLSWAAARLAPALHIHIIVWFQIKPCNMVENMYVCLIFLKRNIV